MNPWRVYHEYETDTWMVTDESKEFGSKDEADALWLCEKLNTMDCSYVK